MPTHRGILPRKVPLLLAPLSPADLGAGGAAGASGASFFMCTSPSAPSLPSTKCASMSMAETPDHPSWHAHFRTVFPGQKAVARASVDLSDQEYAHLQIRFRQGDVQGLRAESNMQSAFPARICRCVRQSARIQTALEAHNPGVPKLLIRCRIFIKSPGDAEINERKG